MPDKYKITAYSRANLFRTDAYDVFPYVRYRNQGEVYVFQ